MSMTLLTNIKENKTPLLIVFASFLLYLLIFWPGELTPDSMVQYSEAKSGFYGDHHPPIMAFLWRYLDMIYEGPGLMLVLNGILLFSSVFLLLKCTDDFKLKLLAFILPFIPHVFSYSGMIWKDVGFAFSFLFLCSFLSYKQLNNKPVKVLELLFLFPILLYGAMVKFQAQYLAPIIIIWLSYSLAGWKVKSWKFLGYSITLLISLFFTAHLLNNFLVPESKKSEAWQLVKFYDLAAISVESEQIYFPEEVLTKHFSMEEMKKSLFHNRVDDLVFREDPLFQKVFEQDQMNKLWLAWARAALEHPIIYLKHRSINLGYIMLSTPGFMRVMEWLNSFSTPEKLDYKVLYFSARVIGYIFLAHLIVAVFSFIYLLLGLYTLKNTPAAIPLIFMNLTGLTMIGVLFFCSMAGTPRYTYITVCLFHASHIFAYQCYLALKKG